jgi:hypothetical protein
MPDVQGTQLDVNELAAVKVAVRGVVNTLTYLGVNVGTHVTDDEITEVATAALMASISYRNGQSI